MSLTARDIIHKIAQDAGKTYHDVAQRVNRAMEQGLSFMESVRRVSSEHGLDPSLYSLEPELVAQEIRRILETDYSQTLMISAVLAQLFESGGENRLPAPAFFAFLELLSETAKSNSDTAPHTQTTKDLEKWTTRVIELTTTLVSLVNTWSREGISGISADCPPALVKIAKSVYLRTKMYQNGMWSCISCGKLVNIRDTRGLLCIECDMSLYRDIIQDYDESMSGLDRVGYGRTRSENDGD